VPYRAKFLGLLEFGPARGRSADTKRGETRCCSIAEAMGISLGTVNGAHMAFDHGGIKGLKPKPTGGRQRENMALAEEKALLARFAAQTGPQLPQLRKRRPRPTQTGSGPTAAIPPLPCVPLSDAVRR
jgi:hypothetical protein